MRPRGARQSGGEVGTGEDKAKENGVDNTEVEVGVLLAGLLAGICHRNIVEMAIAALEAELAISTVNTYRPTTHSPFCF